MGQLIKDINKWKSISKADMTVNLTPRGEQNSSKEHRLRTMSLVSIDLIILYFREIVKLKDSNLTIIKIHNM